VEEAWERERRGKGEAWVEGGGVDEGRGEGRLWRQKGTQRGSDASCPRRQ